MGLPEVADALERAIEAADQLGLDTSEALAVASDIAERGGYPDDLYVLALVGGTGVGKSSLLNAIAGEEVSPAGARRPTTSTPVAWLREEDREAALPLLEWVGGAEVRTKSGDGPMEGGRAVDGRAVAIVDLPDLDSIEPAHAARVDAVLPRVDAVLWVTDPEKYDDAILHDGYLRRWMPRLGHQAVVINKVDRLAADDAGRVRDDLQGRLGTEGLSRVPVLLASATRNVESVRSWLSDGVSAKEVVSARLRSSVAAAVEALARSAGVDGPDAPAPLVTPAARAEAIAAAARAVLDVVDLTGLRDQAVAATRTSARSAGGGPIGLVRTVFERGSGTTERKADPEGYLRRWRERGSLDRAVGPIRHLLVEGLGSVPMDVRPALAGLSEPSGLAERLAQGIDRVVSHPEARFEQPSSRAWPILGLAQLLATAAVVIGLVWAAVLFAAGAPIPTPTLDVPVLGAMPTPAVLIVAGLFGWFLLGRLLRWHAGRLGRRWADQQAEALRGAVAAVAAETVDRSLAAPDATRHAIWSAARAIADEEATDDGAGRTPAGPG